MVFVFLLSFVECSEKCPMFLRQRQDEPPAQDVIVIVEFDLQKMQVRFLWSPDAIRERMLELEHPLAPGLEATGAT